MLTPVLIYEQLVSVRGEAAPNATPVKPTPKPWDWFGSVDANKDGKVTEDKWLRWAKESDIKKSVPFDEPKRKNAFRYFDGDMNGYLTPDELKFEQ